MKIIILAVFLVFGVLSSLTQAKEITQIGEILNLVKNTDPENLSDELKEVARIARVNLATHYCCAVNDRVEKNETRTRTVSFSTVETISTIVGYLQCNTTKQPFQFPTFPATRPAAGVTYQAPTVSICQSTPIYQNFTQLRVQYRAENYIIPVVTVNCPAEHVICCEGYQMINNECVSRDGATLLQQLIELGLIPGRK